MAKKTVSKAQKELEIGHLRATDTAHMQKSVQELAVKRDGLLQEIMELQNEIDWLDAKKSELQARLNHRTTEVVLCEKMMQTFGSLHLNWAQKADKEMKTWQDTH